MYIVLSKKNLPLIQAQSSRNEISYGDSSKSHILTRESFHIDHLSCNILIDFDVYRPNQQLKRKYLR